MYGCRALANTRYVATRVKIIGSRNVFFKTFDGYYCHGNCSRNARNGITHSRSTKNARDEAHHVRNLVRLFLTIYAPDLF